MVYFLSDCHLGAGYISNPRAQEKALASWLDSIGDDASRLYLLGDIIDYWFEYRHVVPRGFTRFLGALARLADKGVEIIWVKGNHDIWMTDYLTSEIGCSVVDGIIDTVIDGRRFVLGHGDGVGRRPLAFRFLRRLFRSTIARIPYAAIHPRWTVGFAHAWSRRSRSRGGYSGGAGAVDSLARWASAFVHDNGHVDFFVFGHLHCPVQVALPAGGSLTVLGDSFSQMSYAAYDGHTLRLMTMPAPRKAAEPAYLT